MTATAQMPALQTLAALQQYQRAIPLPFRLALPDGSALFCTDLLRLLPGKRLVLRAVHNGNTVLAKLFFAARHWQQELDGFALLQTTGVTSPAMLAQHRVDSGGVCLYAFISHATSLDALWQQAPEDRKVLLLDRLLSVLQQCHAKQVLQQDLHLGNFLVTDNELVVLDPASCHLVQSPSAQQDNLALLLAQFSFSDWPTALQALATHFPAIDNHRLLQRAKYLWQQRRRDYLQKILRDCSEVADLGRDNLRILCRREYLSDTLAAHLRDPATMASNATVLKNGNSAKVFLVEIDGRQLVLKQYINKDWLRKLRRAFRMSRAARSWHFAHAFAFAGIRVPAPVALVEQRVGPFVGSAWYVSEYQPGRDLLASWQEREPTDGELADIHALFLLLQHSNTSHGDLKATNLITNGQHVSLIDYDGVREHRWQKTLAPALTADRQRFLQNWADQATLQQRLADVISA